MAGTSLYRTLRQKYLGVTRDAVTAFIRKQPAYQLRKPYVKRVNRPILARRPFDRFMSDLVEIHQFERANNGYKYIMNVVDVFSRYLWSYPLKNKTAEDVLEVMKDIIKKDGKPKVWQSDQGSETKSVVAEFCKEEGIKQVFVKSYSPQGQGLIEGINKLVVRGKLQDAMIRNNSKKWVRFLPDCVESWNNTPHEGQGQHSPLWLFKSPEGEFEEERKDAYKKTEERARKSVAKARAEVFKIGDIVRVAISAVSSKTRRMIKARDGKKVLVKWTPELYGISRVIRSSKKDDGRELPET